MTFHPRVLVLGLSAALGLSAMAGCSTPVSESSPSSIRIASAMAVNWDPFLGANLFFPSTQAVYDPLLMVAAEGVEPEPWLAESYEVSEDGLTMNVTLRDDVEFVDGTHMDAVGMEKFFDAQFEPDATLLAYRAPGTRVTATGEYTLEFVTTQPIGSTFFWALGLTPVSSPATLGVDDAFEDGPVGSGPYVIDEHVPDVSISYVRNPDYWNAEAFPYDEVTILTYADNIAALNALKTGQLDAALSEIPLAREAEAAGLQIFEGPGNVSSLYIADHDGSIAPALGDVRVRQALNMAFDREAILEALNLGFGAVSSQPFSSGQHGYVDGGDDRYPYDPEAARELLADAGFPDGFDVTIPTFGGNDGSVDIFATGAIEPVVQTSLAAIGVNVTFDKIRGELPELLDAWASEKYPIIMTNMPQTNWVSSFDEWFSPHGNPHFAALIETSKSGVPAEQTDALDQIGEFLLDEAWYVPFSRPVAVFAAVPEVQIGISGSYPQPKLWQYTPSRS